MHTRCPQCQTTFSVKPAQLKARDGLVRCGRCMTVFRAEEFVVAKTPGKTPPPATATENSDPHARRKPARKTSPKSASESSKRKKNAGADAEVASDTPLQLKLPGLVPSVQTRLPFWIAGNGLLVLLMLTQGVYFYGSDLVQWAPPIKPALAGVCGVIGCQLTPPQDINLIDLAEARVAPHPKFDKALRIRATLVNRAAFTQAFPIMEVTLSDTSGQVIARRAFKSEEYVEKSRANGQTMPPNVAIPVLLDVTHPDNRALGYEIRLLPAH